MDIYCLICWQGPCSKFGQISFGCARFPGFQVFRHFFDGASPSFREGMHAQAGRQPPDTGGNFLRAEKGRLLMWVLLNLILAGSNLIFVVIKLLKLMFQHDVVGVDVGRVYWFLASVVFSCRPFFLTGSFFRIGFCRSDENLRHTSVCSSLHPPLHFTTVKPT